MLPTPARDFTARRDEAAGSDLSLALARFALWGILVAKLVAGWGVQWDIEWHVRVGRDTFWIAPHLMTYGGVTGSVLLSWGMLAWYTALGPRGAGLVRVLGAWGTPGFQLAAWGNALTVLAAPVDDLWHRLFGLDVTLWSPPHLLGIAGGLVTSAACLAIAHEVYPASRLARVSAMLLGATLLYRGLALVVQPAYLVAHTDGGVWFHLPAVLSAILLPVALVLAARLTGSRWSPAVVLVIALLVAAVGERIADAGFEITHPVSVIAAEIAKDPTSTIAVASRIAALNGVPAGRGGLIAPAVSLVAAAAMGLVDARRWPARAGLVYGLVLLAVSGVLLSRLPAFRPVAPDLAADVVGLAAAGIGGLCAGRAGDWLARAFGAGRGA